MTQSEPMKAALEAVRGMKSEDIHREYADRFCSLIQKMNDKRIDMVGGEQPQTLIETFWLNHAEAEMHDYQELEKATDSTTDKPSYDELAAAVKAFLKAEQIMWESGYGTPEQEILDDKRKALISRIERAKS